MIGKKVWDVRMSKVGFDRNQLHDYSLILQDSLLTPTLFKLGPIQVRRGRVIATLLGFIIYCTYILIKVKNSV